MNPNFKIPITKYSLVMECDADVYISGFLGTTLHGVLGHAIKAAECPQYNKELPGKCAACTCKYSFLFEPGPSDDPRANKEYKDPIRPYYIRCPFNRSSVKLLKGEEVTWELFVIGNSKPDLAGIVNIAKKAGELGLGENRIPFTVQSIISDLCPVIIDSDQELKSRYRVTIHLNSPLDFNNHNISQNTFTFRQFINSILFKLRGLDLFYGSRIWKPRQEINVFTEEAETVHSKSIRLENKRIAPTNKRSENVKYRGWIGEITFEAVPEIYLPYLAAGQQVNIGGLGTHGFGWYSVKNIIKMR